MDQAFRNRVKRELIHNLSNMPLLSLIEEHGTPLLLLEPHKIRDQYRALQDLLPMVDHHFAIKASGQEEAVAAVDQCGGFFDVMTNHEVDMVAARGISPDRCIHTNPIKHPGDIRYAYEHGLRTFVVDNVDEVNKFRPYAGRVELLVRLRFDNPEAKSNLSFKYGVLLDRAAELVRYVREQGLAVAGFTLHVGSQIHSAQAYVEAIEESTKLIDQVEREQGFRMTVLDIGGGFPISYLEPAVSLQEIAAAITPLLEPLARRMRILSEPGRFVVAPAMTLITEVVGRSVRDGQQWYYIHGEGTYGTLSMVKFEDVIPPIFSLRELEADHELELVPSVVGGASCDSGDAITECMLPRLQHRKDEKSPGDLLVIPNVGAYGRVSSTEFNSIPRSKVVVVPERVTASTWPYPDAAAISAAARQPLSTAPSR